MDRVPGEVIYDIVHDLNTRRLSVKVNAFATVGGSCYRNSGCGRVVDDKRVGNVIDDVVAYGISRATRSATADVVKNRSTIRSDALDDVRSQIVAAADIVSANAHSTRSRPATILTDGNARMVAVGNGVVHIRVVVPICLGDSLAVGENARVALNQVICSHNALHDLRACVGAAYSVADADAAVANVIESRVFDHHARWRTVSRTCRSCSRGSRKNTGRRSVSYCHGIKCHELAVFAVDGLRKRHLSIHVVVEADAVRIEVVYLEGDALECHIVQITG